jgi:hypothetical protein
MANEVSPEEQEEQNVIAQVAPFANQMMSVRAPAVTPVPVQQAPVARVAAPLPPTPNELEVKDVPSAPVPVPQPPVRAQAAVMKAAGVSRVAVQGPGPSRAAIAKAPSQQAPVAKRHLPLKGVIASQAMPPVMRAPQPAAVEEPKKRGMLKSAGRSFAQGFMGAALGQMGGVAVPQGTRGSRKSASAAEPALSPQDVLLRNLGQRRQEEQMMTAQVAEMRAQLGGLPADQRADGERLIAMTESENHLSHYVNNDSEHALIDLGYLPARTDLPTPQQNNQAYAAALPGLAKHSRTAAAMQGLNTGPTSQGVLAADKALAAGQFAGVTSSGEALPAGPASAIMMAAEAAEGSLSTPTGTPAGSASPSSGSDVAARMERFPELRGIEMPTGNAARFPELSAEAPQPQAPVHEQDGGMER